jgi:hypothetical protein
MKGTGKNMSSSKDTILVGPARTLHRCEPGACGGCIDVEVIHG